MNEDAFPPNTKQIFNVGLPKSRKTQNFVLILKVSTTVKIRLLVLWLLTSCSLVGGYRSFGKSYCLHLQEEVGIYKFMRRQTLEEHNRSYFLQILVILSHVLLSAYQE
jgi:hypothetical protein